MVSRKRTIVLLVAALGVGGLVAVRWAGSSRTGAGSDGERSEPPPARPDPRAELTRLQGAWEVEGVQGDGLDDQKALVDHFRSLTLVFKDDRLVTWGMPDDTIAELRIDADRQPKGLEVTQTKRLLGKDKVIHWAYELDGDRLAIAFRKDNGRPTATTVPAAAGGASKTVRLSLRRTAEDPAGWTPPPGGPDPAALRMFAAAAREIDRAKTATWRVTMYRRRTGAGNGKLPGWRDERRYFKAPGRYRAEAVDERGQVTSISIDDVVGMRQLLIDPQKKTAVLHHLSEQRFPVEGPFPQQAGYFRLKGKALTPIAADTIGTREVIGYRAAFHLPREDEGWSYDFLFDAKSGRMTGYRVPGRDVLDPDKVYPEATLQLREQGFLWHDIAFNVDLDDALFSFDPPRDYRLTVKGVPRVAEADAVEFLGVVADYMGGSFPRDVLEFNSGPEYLRFERIEREKKREDRTPAENRMVDAMHRWWSEDVPGPGPMRLFIERETEAGTWRYVGGGVKRGDGTKPVCWYRRRGEATFRVVFGDLSVRDVPADRLPGPDPAVPAPADQPRPQKSQVPAGE